MLVPGANRSMGAPAFGPHPGGVARVGGSADADGGRDARGRRDAGGDRAVARGGHARDAERAERVDRQLVAPVRGVAGRLAPPRAVGAEAHVDGSDGEARRQRVGHVVERREHVGVLDQDARAPGGPACRTRVSRADLDGDDAGARGDALERGRAARGDPRHVGAVVAVGAVGARRGGAGAELGRTVVRAVAAGREARLGDDAAAEEGVAALHAGVEDHDRGAGAVEARRRGHVRSDAGDALGEARPEQPIGLDREHVRRLGQLGELARARLEGEERERAVTAQRGPARPAQAAERRVGGAGDLGAARPLRGCARAARDEGRREAHDHPSPALALGRCERIARDGRRGRSRVGRARQAERCENPQAEAHGTCFRAPILRDDPLGAKRRDATPGAELAQDLVRVLPEARGRARRLERLGAETGRRPRLAQPPADRMFPFHEGAVRDDLPVRVQLVELAHHAARARPRPRSARGPPRA